MEYKYYIGIDVSKLTLDFTVLKDGNFFLHEQIANNVSSIKGWLKTAMASSKLGGKKSLFCMESCDIYGVHLKKVLLQKKVPLWVESALQIHLSFGLQRGKSDKTDSLRIAQYAYTHRKKARFFQEPRDIIEQLKYLRTLRLKLSQTIVKLKIFPKELTQFNQKKQSENLLVHSQASLNALDNDLRKVNKTISTVIKKDNRLCQLYKWVTSVTGIGDVLATELLIATNEFKNFDSARKFACHCGIAPFRYTSGTSTNSKARVSQRANKKIKHLLHMAAMSAIQVKGDLQTYYQRRILAGYAKLSVLNAVRNKIIQRAFTCVREERIYIKNAPFVSKG